MALSLLVSPRPLLRLLPALLAKMASQASTVKTRLALTLLAIPCKTASMAAAMLALVSVSAVLVGEATLASAARLVATMVLATALNATHAFATPDMAVLTALAPRLTGECFFFFFPSSSLSPFCVCHLTRRFVGFVQQRTNSRFLRSCRHCWRLHLPPWLWRCQLCLH